MEISIENWESLNDLERAFYEKQTYESLLSYMADNGVVTTSNYFDEYRNVVKVYLQLCRKLEDEIILPAVGETNSRWEVDFLDKCVKIREAAV